MYVTVSQSQAEQIENVIRSALATIMTETLAEFQHVNCMIVRIWEVKRVACYMLGLKLLLRRLPQW